MFTSLVLSANALSYNEWVRAFPKNYGKNYIADNEEYRRSIFEQNLREIEAINSRGLSWTAGVNEYADLTWEEFKTQIGLATAPQNCSATHSNHKKSGVSIPDDDEVDWTKKGVVTPVKNQGSCGSCWTFSTTGAIESAFAIKTGQLVSLSEQQLVDCAGAFNNFGCNGGLPSQAFQYVIYNGGIDTETAYPYEGRDGRCRYLNDTKSIGAKLTNEVNVTALDETELTDAIKNQGPVSICYEVVSDFRFYTGGVYESTQCKNGPQDVNHAVLAVGYGVDTASSKPYYLVKNSWGRSFGIDGYFKIVRGKNMCGLATCASYPIV